MRRRDFMAVMAGVAIAPRAVAQPASLRSIGILHSAVLETSRDYLAAFEAGLAESGFKKGQNIAFEYRAANNELDRLSNLAGDLVRQKVDVIFVGANTAAVLAAKRATTSTPIVFVMGADPVGTGIVPSLAKPGGNITGITGLAGQLLSKRLQLLLELVPNAKTVGYIINPANPAFTEAAQITNAEMARAAGVELFFARASNLAEIETAFATLARDKPDALLLGADTAFNSFRVQIVALAERYALPTSYPVREFVEAGGLSSYSTDYFEVYRQCGVYVARVLKGEAPGELPVQQPTSFKFALNQGAAKRIGLELPPVLLARADEVIE